MSAKVSDHALYYLLSCVYIASVYWSIGYGKQFNFAPLTSIYLHNYITLGDKRLKFHVSFQVVKNLGDRII